VAGGERQARHKLAQRGNAGKARKKNSDRHRYDTSCAPPSTNFASHLTLRPHSVDARLLALRAPNNTTRLDTRYLPINDPDAPPKSREPTGLLVQIIQNFGNRNRNAARRSEPSRTRLPRQKTSHPYLSRRLPRHPCKPRRRCRDLIFADPPYFAWNNGITCHAGKMVSVNKGEWDRSRGADANHEFNRAWLAARQRVLKPNGTIWVTGTSHVIHSVGFAMQQLEFKLLNDTSWVKPNPPPNLSNRRIIAAPLARIARHLSLSNAVS
jgi:hypothetical protein